MKTSIVAVLLFAAIICVKFIQVLAADWLVSVGLPPFIGVIIGFAVVGAVGMVILHLLPVDWSKQLTNRFK